MFHEELRLEIIKNWKLKKIFVGSSCMYILYILVLRCYFEIVKQRPLNKNALFEKRLRDDAALGHCVDIYQKKNR